MKSTPENERKSGAYLAAMQEAMQREIREELLKKEKLRNVDLIEQARRLQEMLDGEQQEINRERWIIDRMRRIPQPINIPQEYVFTYNGSTIKIDGARIWELLLALASKSEMAEMVARAISQIEPLGEGK